MALALLNSCALLCSTLPAAVADLLHMCIVNSLMLESHPNKVSLANSPGDLIPFRRVPLSWSHYSKTPLPNKIIVESLDLTRNSQGYNQHIAHLFRVSEVSPRSEVTRNTCCKLFCDCKLSCHLLLSKPAFSWKCLHKRSSHPNFCMQI